MALTREEDNILEGIFEIDTDIKLVPKDWKYLSELTQEISELVAEYGTEGDVRIKEVVLDTLLRDKKQDIINYLSLDFEKDIEDKFEDKLKNSNFLKIENKEGHKDFFLGYLVDESVNDLYYSWKGYIRKSDGAKETFEKVRKAIIPSRQIDALYNLLTDNFNKINFLSEKQDEEQADLIIFTLEQSLDILLEIPNACCDTPRVIEIMSGIALKMTNLIGYSKGNRDKILSALSDSYQSKHTDSNRTKTTEND